MSKSIKKSITCTSLNFCFEKSRQVLLVIRSVTDILRAQGRFVKHILQKYLGVQNVSVTDLYLASRHFQWIPVTDF